MAQQVNEELLEQIIVDAINRSESGLASGVGNASPTGSGGFMRIGDGANLDAFSRLRTSENNILGNYQFIYDKNPLLFGETTGSLSTIHEGNKAIIRMRVAENTAESVVRQSKKYHRYQAGQSQFCVFTFASGSQEDSIIKEVGYYDDDNGLFLRIPPPDQEVSFVIRSNTTGTPTERVFPQSEWNIDKFDGTGPSGITIDFSKSQILVIDFQWLGVGRVRYGFDVDGILYYAHQVFNANNLDEVYMSRGSLPVRYRIENVGSGSATEFHQICSTVVREGNRAEPGFLTSIGTSNPSSGNPVDSQEPESILHVRLKDGFTRSFAEFVNLTTNVYGSTNNWRFFVVLNAEFVEGPPSGSWNPVTEVSTLESNEEQLTYVTGSGHILYSIIYSGGGNADRTQGFAAIENTLGLSADIAGNRDIITVFAQDAAPGTEDASCTMTFLERL